MNENTTTQDPPHETEEEAIAARRRIAGVDPNLPRCGLALSGGGIRSATFCLGLIRALAANGVLKRFDYLSTVSGGGYAGVALGRLYRGGTPVSDIEEGLARDNSLLLWWLRANGRYLIPAGMRDLLRASASQVRGFLATQFETAVLALLLAALIVLPHVLIQTFGLPLAVRPWLQAVGTLWWAALPLPVLGAGVAIFAYWFSRDEREESRWADPLCAAVVLAVVIWLGAQLWGTAASTGEAGMQLAVLGIALLLVACVPIGYVVHLACGCGIAADDRIRYTGWLGGAIAAFGAILAFGLADLVTWLAAWLWIYGDDYRITGGAGFAVVALIVARAVLPVLEKWQRSSAGGLPLERLANIAGLLLVALLALLWLTLLQAFVFLAEDGPAMQALMGGASVLSGVRWGVVVALAALYALVTFRNLPQLNRSSLHEFYRSRLARTYVSVGNWARPGTQGDPQTRFPACPLTANSRVLTEATEKVTRMLAGDDVPLGDYRPHAAGGPIHLINGCINQTRDDRTGSYNADRKGIALTVSAFGLETGTQPPVPVPGLGEMPLSRWVAISGAAASSGMGSFTRPGTSALLFLSGLRLGYWWRRLEAPLFDKYRAVLSEMLARFPGLRSPAWYVSDGGHFDNTGVYALLKRRLPVIVLADCGADPRYLFADLESLVRKARLDYAAHIEFVDPHAVPDPEVAALLGTPDTIGPEPGNEHLLLARIRYADGSTGALLVVKPRRLPTLPLDIVGYADRDPAFPQQNTGDQFFDEAQWESYHALGRRLGASVTARLLDRLPEWTAHAPVTDVASVTPAQKEARRVPSRRERMVATVGTSLGVGAFASVLLAAWQLWDEHNRLEAERQRAFLEASARMADAIAGAKGTFSPELKLRLDSLITLASEATGGEAQRRQTLVTLADSLEPICQQQNDREARQCNAYLGVLRGQERDGPIAQALAQYWVDKSHAMAAPVLAAEERVQEVLPPPAAPAAPEPSAPTPPSAGTARPDPAYPRAAPAVPPQPSRAAPVMQATEWRSTDCQPATKTGITLYIHIYDEAERPVARAIAQRAIEAGLAVPRIENVVLTAQQQAKAPPARWRQATWLYRGPDGQRCAAAAQRWLATAADPAVRRPSQLVELPAALRASRGVIELWLPPATAAAAAS